MLFKGYKNKFIELVVKLQLLEGQDFVLKKNKYSEYTKAHN